ncbi:MAG: hypothetical protein KA184_11715 [Candidatus Hydrogenedentes bacterium]|nr:hypothetical protein [Candidatus Hydrogenedentota bacterium]
MKKAPHPFHEPFRYPRHCSLVADDGGMLHVFEGVGSCLAQYTRPIRSSRSMRAYRYWERFTHPTDTSAKTTLTKIECMGGS